MDRIGVALEAANNKTESAEERTRADGDLKAQQSMANAANVMIYVGSAEALITLAGVLLVLATLIYTKKAAGAAIASAEAAQKTVASMEDTARRQLRAYLMVQGEGVKYWGDKGGTHVTAKIRVHNNGQTPAKNVSAAHEVKLFDKVPDSDFTGEALGKTETDTTIDPGRTRSFTAASAGAIPQSPAVASAEGLTVVVYGVVQYTDVFGDRHNSKFCHTYRRPYFEEDIVRYHRLGNCAD